MKGKLWGGRFGETTDRAVARFTASVDVDRRLYHHDILGSVAHVRMLAQVGVLTTKERDQIVQGLEQIESDIEAGRFAWNDELEDVHTNIEARLTERIGEVGKKLHTARSRNDQVATDLRLYVRDGIDAVRDAVKRLQQAILARAESEADTVAENSIDAVSDRDFAVEFVAACAVLMMHLSRVSEEIILWSSPLIGFVELADAYCTGSSIMPQKKNPDVAELVRGKSARVQGHLTTLLALMKAQPLAYNRDNQEDKVAVFDTFDTTLASVEVYAGLIETASFNRHRMAHAAALGYATATDLADYLVR